MIDISFSSLDTVAGSWGAAFLPQIFLRAQELQRLYTRIEQHKSIMSTTGAAPPSAPVITEDDQKIAIALARAHSTCEKKREKALECRSSPNHIYPCMRLGVDQQRSRLKPAYAPLAVLPSHRSHSEVHPGRDYEAGVSYPRRSHPM